MFQAFLAAVTAAMRSAAGFARSLVRRFGWKKIAIAAVAALALFIIVRSFSGGAAEVAPVSDTRTVHLETVAALSQNTSSLSVAGVVSSKSEATVRAEKSGQVTSLNYELGQYVGAGAVVAQLENASERAALLQAQAGVEAATASAGISGSSAVSTLLSAYAAVDNAVENTADPMFVQPSTAPHTYYLRVTTTSDAAKRAAESARSALDAVLAREKSASASVSSSADLSAELARTETELLQTRAFLDSLIQALNEAKPDQVVTAEVLAGYQASTIAARSSVTASLTAVSSARQSIDSASAGATASSAALKQAEAGLAAARATYEHTLIRAPISGTINSLPLKRGDYVQLGSPVLTVANNGALEVVAYVTEADAAELSVGSTAKLGNGAQGVVTRIAPAVDPLTKKIEVRIGLSGNPGLINGQSVTADLARSAPKSDAAPARLVIPLPALKISADGMSVFTVDENGALVAHPLKIGELLGDRVEVIEGLTGDMAIVTDARGLRAGETVTVAQ
ncbi:MAG TPA: efflux RND transporter periplasmic adaptor subunit [Candidatus Paceibacterota bacterium]|nr:efflux RND transporter periplasmic adaptor subunit [Candidatus Paceibacterota bacterium]